MGTTATNIYNLFRVAENYVKTTIILAAFPYCWQKNINAISSMEH